MMKMRTKLKRKWGESIMVKRECWYYEKEQVQVEQYQNRQVEGYQLMHGDGRHKRNGQHFDSEGGEVEIEFEDLLYG